MRLWHAKVQREGGGPAGEEAAKNYIDMAVSKFKNKVSKNNSSYVLFNSWTKRVEYLYAKRFYSDRFDQSWSRSTKEFGIDDGTEGDAEETAATPAATAATKAGNSSSLGTVGMGVNAGQAGGSGGKNTGGKNGKNTGGNGKRKREDMTPQEEAALVAKQNLTKSMNLSVKYHTRTVNGGSMHLQFVGLAVGGWGVRLCGAPMQAIAKPRLCGVPLQANASPRLCGVGGALWGTSAGHCQSETLWGRRGSVGYLCRPLPGRDSVG